MRRTYRNLHILLMLLLCFASSFLMTSREVIAENVSNLEVYSDGKGVDIYYDIVDSESSELYEVELFVSPDGGKNYTIIPKSVSADIGRGISPGERKHIRWDTVNDMGEFITSEAVFKIRTRRLSPDEVRNISGKISINGFSDRENVFIDGKKLGETPIPNELLSLGSHLVHIRRSGFEDYTKNIQVIRGERTVVNYSLIPKSRTRVFTNSLIFPGSGQRYAEYRAKGNIITGL